jgi:hypothetical protein
MEVVTVRDKVGLFIEEGYSRMQETFQYELTKEEQAIFIWNANACLNNILKRRG